jgi:hypothetical protein
MAGSKSKFGEGCTRLGAGCTRLALNGVFWGLGAPGVGCNPQGPNGTSGGGSWGGSCGSGSGLWVGVAPEMEFSGPGTHRTGGVLGVKPGPKWCFRGLDGPGGGCNPRKLVEHGYELERVVGDTITLEGYPVGRGGTGNVILRSVRAFQPCQISRVWHQSGCF